MCIIQMQIQCLDSFNEMLSEDMDNTEITIETIVTMRLLDLFDEVVVKDVVMSPLSIIKDGQRQMFFRICCQCPLNMRFLSQHERENIELTVEDVVSCVMVELFETVIVEKVTLVDFPWDDDNVIELPRSA
jgi:hypothetical protein